jgi:hypothetical protein
MHHDDGFHAIARPDGRGSEWELVTASPIPDPIVSSLGFDANAILLKPRASTY